MNNRKQLKLLSKNVRIGKPHIKLVKLIRATDTFNTLLNKLSKENIDLAIPINDQVKHAFGL